MRLTLRGHRALRAALLAAPLALAGTGLAADAPKPRASPGAARPTPAPSPTPLDCASVKARVTAETLRCPEEAKEASSLVCSAGGHARLLALDLACARARSPRGEAKSPLAAPLESRECRALSLADGSLLAEATSGDYQDCVRRVQADLVARKCTGEVKAIDYLFLRGAHEPYAFTVRCP